MINIFKTRLVMIAYDLFTDSGALVCVVIISEFLFLMQKVINLLMEGSPFFLAL